MSNYLKLVNFEVKRFFKIFIVLAMTIIVAQIVAITNSASNFVSQAEKTMIKEKLLAEEYVVQYGGYSAYNFLNTGLFQLSIMFGAAVLIIYVFFIWYRDWLGKSSFVYRLLTLPTKRSNVYFAKLTTILLFVLSLVSIQLALFKVIEQILYKLVPAELLASKRMLFPYSYDILPVLYPQTVVDFIVIYGIGITIVAVIFTAILFERSFQLKGIFLAGVYTFLSGAVLLIPVIISSTTDYFYKQEIAMFFILCSVVTLTAAIFMANYLLTRKITV